MSIFCIIKVKILSKDKILDLPVVSNFNLDTGDTAGDSTDTGESGDTESGDSGEPGDAEAIGVPGGAGGMESVS